MTSFTVTVQIELPDNNTQASASRSLKTIIQHGLDTLHRNAPEIRGLWIATSDDITGRILIRQIPVTVKPMKKNTLYCVAIFQDRYEGTYSRGKWIAIADATKSPIDIEEELVEYLDRQYLDYMVETPRLDLVLSDAHNGDSDALNFWDLVREKKYPWIAVGYTPQEAYDKLRQQNP